MYAFFLRKVLAITNFKTFYSNDQNRQNLVCPLILTFEGGSTLASFCWQTNLDQAQSVELTHWKKSGRRTDIKQNQTRPSLSVCVSLTNMVDMRRRIN